MGILARLFGRKEKDFDSERYPGVSKEPMQSAEQTQMNRDLMESQMADSRKQLDEDHAAEDRENAADASEEDRKD